VVGLQVLDRGDAHLRRCTHWASSAGSQTQNGLSPATPFRPQDFWSVAGPGKTLCLLNGTYTGSAFMISPENQGGTPPVGSSGNPVTIRAVNDGGVVINGQFARRPLNLFDARWVEVEGFDVCKSNESVVGARFGQNITFRRMIAYEALDVPDSTDFIVWSLGGSVGSTSHGPYTLEDVAGFGRGRKMFQCINCEPTFTVRRAWARHGGYASTSSFPRSDFELMYVTRDGLWENVVGTWSEELATNPTGDGISANAGVNWPGFISSSDPAVIRVLGSITYLKCDATAFSMPYLMRHEGSRPAHTTYKNVVSIVEDGCWANKKPIQFDIIEVTHEADRITAIGGSGTGGGSSSYAIHSSWGATNLSVAANLAAAPNPYTGSNAANVCKRYVNGTLTSEPLWPWPMDYRIKNALAREGLDSLEGSGGTVTSEIEYLLGPIPAACRKP
jgi:hypothetical protein